MRRPFRWVIALVAWVVVAVAPAQAASPGTTTDGLTTTTGVLRVLHADDFAHDTARFVYSLKTSTGWLALDFPEGGPMDQGGATVQVTGRFADGRLEVATDAPDHGIRILKKASPLYRSGGQTFHHDATGAHVPDDPGAVSMAGNVPADPEMVPADPAAAAAATPVKRRRHPAQLLEHEPHGQPGRGDRDHVRQSRPASRTSSPRSPAARSRSAARSSAGTTSPQHAAPAAPGAPGRARPTAKAQAAGVNLDSFDHVVFAWPSASSCAWAGMGYMPGPTSWNNGSFDLRVLAHELSHNFGTNHASTLQCTQGATIVSLSATCSYNEYGDPFSVMGVGSTYHNDGEQVGELGWLRAGELATVVPGGTYTVTPLLTGPAGSPKVLRIVRQSGTSFFVDVRVTFGPNFDKFSAGSPAVTGVMIRLSADAGVPIFSPTNTKLVDTTPGTSTYLDAPLTVGQTLTDPVSHISITTLSVDASGASIRVTESVAPSAPAALSGVPFGPHAVDLSWSAATDNIAVTGYRLQRDGADVATLGPSARAYHDAGLATETGYHYTLVAFDGSGNDGPAASVNVTTTPDDPVPPTAPTNLVGTPTAATVALSWTAGTDDQAVAGYRVSRNGVAVATVTGTSWTDTKRTPKTTYTYDVVTLDRAANTSPAATVVVLTLARHAGADRPDRAAGRDLALDLHDAELQGGDR